MFKAMIKHWSKNPLGLTIIILGYVITILVISMMISDIQNKIITVSQRNFGEKSNRTAILLYTDVGKKYSYNTIDVIKYLGSYGEADIIKMQSVIFKNGSKTAQGEITPYYYEKQPDWQPIMYKGRHLTPQECMNNSKSAVIGLKIAETLGVSVNDKIEFCGSEYTVTGIVGKKNLSTNFDQAVYIPIGALPKKYLSLFDQQVNVKNGDINTLNIYILFRVKNSNFDSIINNLNSRFRNNTFRYDTSLYDAWSIGVEPISALTDILLICVPLLIIAIVNITNISIFWVTSRKKEISIKKVLGANDEYIKITVKQDMLFVSVVSALLAMLLQLFLYIKIEPVVNNYGFSFNLSWVNLFVAIAVSYAIGYIASLIPIDKTLDMNPADALKTE